MTGLLTLRAERRATHDALSAVMRERSPDGSVLAGLLAQPNELMGLVNASGAAVVGPGQVATCGRTVDRQGTDYDETYTYDNCTNGVGLLCSVTNGAGETVGYQYDGFGDIATMTTGNKSMSYQYDAQGHVAKITYPSGRTVNYVFNGGGQATAVTVSENGNTATLASNITYQPFGPVTGWTYGNNLTHTRTYDKQNWTRSIATPNVSTLVYPTYDANGNLRTLTVDGTSDQFTYDTFDELNTGSGDFGARSYGYDEVGNRISLTANGASSTYGYTPNTNRLSGQTGWSYTLDAAGNTVQKLATDGSGSGYQYVYSPHNRLIAVYDLLALAAPKASYAYNALGQRSQKVEQHRNNTLHLWCRRAAACGNRCRG